MKILQIINEQSYSDLEALYNNYRRKIAKMFQYIAEFEDADSTIPRDHMWKLWYQAENRANQKGVNSVFYILTIFLRTMEGRVYDNHDIENFKVYLKTRDPNLFADLSKSERVER